MKVLIIDDEEMIARAIGRILRTIGCEIFEARNGQEGLILVAEKRPDLIISDVQMPCMDGASFVKSLRSQGDETPVVLISGCLGRFEEAVNALIESGQIRGLINKPFDPDEIKSLVQR